MTDNQLKSLCNLLMVNDPFPLSSFEEENIVDIVNSESYKKGYNNWIEAYHYL